MSPSHKIKGWTNDEAAVVFCGREQLLFGTDFDFFDMIFKILHIHKKHWRKVILSVKKKKEVYIKFKF